MAEAIIGGILATPGWPNPPDMCSRRTRPVPRREYLSEPLRRFTAVEDNLEDGPKDAELVVLAVKPQDLAKAGVRSAEAAGWTKDRRSLSIIAGARMTTLSQGLEHDCRDHPGDAQHARPRSGAGMSLWTCSEPEVGGEQRNELTGSILDTVGRADIRRRREVPRHGHRPQRQRPRLRVHVRGSPDRRRRVRGTAPGHGPHPGPSDRLRQHAAGNGDRQAPRGLKDMVVSPEAPPRRASRPWRGGACPPPWLMRSTPPISSPSGWARAEDKETSSRCSMPCSWLTCFSP